MASSRFFVFLYPEPSPEKTYLDLAIYLLNPKEKWPAHVTVAGPFVDRSRFQITVREYQSTVFLYSPSNFFRYEKPTVFLHAGFQELDAIWRKPDFKGSNPIPHVTLYDGDDKKFARRVFQMLQETKLSCAFNVRGLHVVESIPGQYRNDLQLAAQLDEIDETRGMSHRDVSNLQPRERLRLARIALERIPVTHFPFAS